MLFSLFVEIYDFKFRKQVYLLGFITFTYNQYQKRILVGHHWSVYETNFRINFV